MAEKIRTLFREQGITIASILMAIVIPCSLNNIQIFSGSILMAIGMAISVLFEAFMPGGGGGTAASGSEPPPEDEKGLKEWIRSKLKALALLLGKFDIKAAEALPGIIGAIISWILSRAKEVVGRVSQHLWALVVGVGGLIYTYMVTK